MNQTDIADQLCNVNYHPFLDACFPNMKKTTNKHNKYE